jgi:hypothetical protein
MPATTSTAHRQTWPVIVAQPQALMAQLRLQDAVLFAQVLDDVVLFPLEPGEERRHEQVQRNHPSGLRHRPAAFSDTTGHRF